MMKTNDFFHFPESSAVNQRIAKVLFAENGPLLPADRKAFKEEIEEIYCSYVLDSFHEVMLNVFTDEDHDYSCLAQIDVTLRKNDKALRIAELCHRAMPYPLLVILHDGEMVMFSMADKRFSHDGKEQVVLEQVTHTGWWKMDQLDDFFKAADFKQFRQADFKQLYAHYTALLDMLKTAEITGTFREDKLTPDERRRLLTELHQLQNQLAELKAKAKKEAELSRLVEINMQAKNIESAINKTKKMLGE